MRCLHICNDFSLTKVHKNLYTQLDENDVEQIIFNPVRPTTPVGNNTIDFKTENSKILYSKMLKKHHKIFFRSKMGYLFNDLEKRVDLRQINLVHATTFFSDGAVALKIHNTYKTPFVVAVRGTDISVFLRLRPDLTFIAREIIEKASKVIFISNSLMQSFANHRLLRSKKSILTEKSELIYNGIDNYWLDNRFPSKEPLPKKILFVGRFIPTKNIKNLIAAVEVLRKDGYDLVLQIVGAGGEEETIVKDLAQKKDFVDYMGAIKDRGRLQEVYRHNDIFAMPSSAETFGLVYIEALSQGLPILYNRGQGVDGVFEDSTVGEKCDGTNSDEIISALQKMVDNYSDYNIEKVDFSQFRWSNIAKRYTEIYKRVR